MSAKSEASAPMRPFVGRLLFDSGQVCEQVEGELGEDHDPRHGTVGRKVYAGRLWCELGRETVEILGREATLQTDGGLKARIAFKAVVDDEEEGSRIDFSTIGSATTGSYDRP